MDEQQREHLLYACDEILDADDDGVVAAIIAWPDPTKPSGVGTIILPEGNGERREGDCNFILAEDEAQVRDILTTINERGPWPIVPLGQLRVPLGHQNIPASSARRRRPSHTGDHHEQPTRAEPVPREYHCSKFPPLPQPLCAHRPPMIVSVSRISTDGGARDHKGGFHHTGRPNPAQVVNAVDQGVR